LGKTCRKPGKGEISNAVITEVLRQGLLEGLTKALQGKTSAKRRLDFGRKGQMKKKHRSTKGGRKRQTTSKIILTY